MGRARTKPQKSRTATSESTPSIASLLSKGQDLVVQCDYSLARKFIERVLAREDAAPSEKNQAKEMLATVLLELGEMDQAKQIFLTLVPPHTEAPSPSAYLYLAQLTDDDPRAALAYYQSAIDLLQTQLKGKCISTANSSSEEDSDDAEIKGNIVRAYLGMVEIWMDPEYDLCVDPAASSTCDALLSHALQIDPQNLEALQTLASVRLSQEKPDEALRALRTFPPPPDATAHPQSHARRLLDAFPVQMRIARAKLLIECCAYPDAISLLEDTLTADDANVEGWYLTGWSWYLLAERKKNGNDVDDIAGLGDGEDNQLLEWEDLAREARDCLEMCQTLHKSQEYPDAPLVEHVKELINILDALGVQPSPEEEDGDDDEWEGISNEDEDVEMA